MITPDYLTYTLDMLQTHKELNESILRDIVRRIVKTDIATETAAWQTEKAQQAGMVYKDVVAYVSGATGKTKAEIKRIFADAEVEVFNYDDELLVTAGVNPTTFRNLSPAMKQVMQAALTKTTTDSINLTKTTANTAQSLFIRACDLAHMQVASGAFSYQQAIASGIKSVAQQGLTVLYPTGHIAGLDYAMRRNVLTGVNQTAARLQEMRMEEMGIDLVEVSAHEGARPTHAHWQGGIYSFSGTHKVYKSLEKETGYGTGDGLCGWNCRHNFFMFFEGASTPAYTQEELDEYKNHTVTYNDKTYTDYEASQTQRGMERGIRATKQELVMLDEAIKNGTDLKNEFNAASVKLKKQEAKLRDFCNQTDRRVDNFRTQVFAADTEKGIKNFGRSTSMKAVWADRRDYEKVVAVLGKEKFPKSVAFFRRMPYNDKEGWKKLMRNVTLFEKIDNNQNYSPDYKKKMKEIYDFFQENDFEITEHGLGRIIGQKSGKNKKTFDNYELLEVLRNKPNYIQNDGKLVRFFNNISVIQATDTGEIVSVVVRNKIRSDWKEIK